MRALEILAAAHDVQEGSRRHSQALAAGLAALDEAEDFVPRGSRLQADLDVAFLAKNHKTPVVREDPSGEVSPLLAQQRYYTYAQEQLGAASGNQTTASVALYAMGKLYAATAAGDPPQPPSAEARAMVFHQAALLADERNYLAANELAVLVARSGNYRRARALLLSSLKVCPQPQAWENLAVVHERLGETRLAQLARNEARLARDVAEKCLDPAAASHALGAVRWVEPHVFAANRAADDGGRRPDGFRQ